MTSFDAAWVPAVTVVRAASGRRFSSWISDCEATIPAVNDSVPPGIWITFTGPCVDEIDCDGGGGQQI